MDATSKSVMQKQQPQSATPKPSTTKAQVPGALGSSTRYPNVSHQNNTPLCTTQLQPPETKDFPIPLTLLADLGGRLQGGVVRAGRRGPLLRRLALGRARRRCLACSPSLALGLD
jgi:hypothetical protein